MTRTTNHNKAAHGWSVSQ